MGSPFVSEIRLFAGPFEPSGWRFCNGQLLSIATQEVLFEAIGTTYGGDGRTNFALPDLRGRVPVHRSASRPLASQGGVERVTLNTGQLPRHRHRQRGSTNVASSADPTGAVPASLPVQTNRTAYGTDPPVGSLDASAVAHVGGGQSHENRQPFTAVSFILATLGIPPSQGGADLDQFVGEIRIFPYTFVPVGWAACDGQTLPIVQNTALFSLLGTTYGGDGHTTFALPNLRDSVPIGQGQGPGLSNAPLGQRGGARSVTLTTAEIPDHTHVLNVSGGASVDPQPNGELLAAGVGIEFYAGAAPPSTPLADAALQSVGNGAAHDNVMPSLALRFCIALQGTFPTH